MPAAILQKVQQQAEGPMELSSLLLRKFHFWHSTQTPNWQRISIYSWPQKDTSDMDIGIRIAEYGVADSH